MSSKKKLSVKELERRSKQRQAQGLNKSDFFLQKSRIAKNGVIVPPYNNLSHFGTITTLPYDAADMLSTATTTTINYEMLLHLRMRRYLNRLIQANRTY